MGSLSFVAFSKETILYLLPSSRFWRLNVASSLETACKVVVCINKVLAEPNFRYETVIFWPFKYESKAFNFTLNVAEFLVVDSLVIESIFAVFGMVLKYWDFCFSWSVVTKSFLNGTYLWLFASASVVTWVWRGLSTISRPWFSINWYLLF